MFMGKSRLLTVEFFLTSRTLYLICCILLSGESGNFQKEVQFATNFGSTKRFSSLYNSSKVQRRQHFYAKNTFSTYFVTRSIFGDMSTEKENFAERSPRTETTFFQDINLGSFSFFIEQLDLHCDFVLKNYRM